MSNENPKTCINQPSQLFEGRLQEIQGNLSEAPAVIFTKLYGLLTPEEGKDPQVIEFNLTVRGSDPKEVIDRIFEASRYAKDKYKLSLANPNVRNAPKASGQPSAPSAPGAQRAPAGAQGTGTTPQSGGVVNAVKMEVVRGPDGKVTLKWYRAGDRYPEIYTTRTPEKALELLRSTGEDWREEHLAGSYMYNDIRHVIHFRFSEKTNSKGNPYKDIVEIRSA